MASFRVVLVEPKSEGNVGFVARAMKNFGVSELVLVGGPDLGGEARMRAMHAADDVLAGARRVSDLDAALRGSDLVVGTTGVPTTTERKFLRIPITPAEFARRVADVDGTVAVLFGREDFGLFDEELRRCDLLVSIPTSKAYPILNVSHAAAIVLYELSGRRPTGRVRKASGAETERLHDAFADMLAATDYPAHKVDRTKIMFRRIVGRAVPTKWEFHALIGVLTRAAKRIRRLEGRR